MKYQALGVGLEFHTEIIMPTKKVYEISSPGIRQLIQHGDKNAHSVYV